MSGKDKKAQFYVEYLGWKESRGLRGSENVSPVVVFLLSRYQNARRTINLPKLTIQVSKNKGLKISSQEVIEEKKRKKIKTVKYPTIPANDIAYASQAPKPNENVVSCIYLGYHPKTEKYAHVHVYSFDRTETAVKFVGLLNQIIEIPNNVKRLATIELDLIAKGQMEPSVSMRQQDAQGNHTGAFDAGSERHTTSSGNSIHSDDARYSGGSDDIDPDLRSLAEVLPYDSVTAELQERLANKTAPLVHPPKDYSTILRKHGDTDIETRKRGGVLNILHFDKGPNTDLNVSNDSEVASPVDDSTSSNNNDSPRSAVSSGKGSFLFKAPKSPDDDPSEYKINSKFSFAEQNQDPPPLVINHGRQRSQSSTHSNRSRGSSNADLRDSSEHVRIYPGALPEPDYQPEEVIIRNNSVGNWRRKLDLSKSMQEADFRTRSSSEGPAFHDEQRMLHPYRNSNGVSLSPRPFDIPTSRVRPFYK